jgi:hypothetical protein
MSAGTTSVTHPAHRHAPRIGAQRIVSMVASAARRTRSDGNFSSHPGQLGPLRESELGRWTGARI